MPDANVQSGKQHTQDDDRVVRTERPVVEDSAGSADTCVLMAVGTLPPVVGQLGR